MKTNKDLKKFLDENSIDAEIIEVKKGSKTVREAAVALGIHSDIIVKSIVFVTKSGHGLICIIQGKYRVDHQKVEKIIGETVNTASSDEVLNYTKYKAGGVPPIGTGVKNIIDENVLKLRECYAGGGTENHLVRIRPHDIKKYAAATVGEIKK